MELGLHFTELTCCEQTGRLVMSHEETMETAIAEYCPDMTRIVSVCGQLQIRERTALEGRVTATGTVGGNRCVVGVLDSRFLMGSMSAAVGEKLTLAIEHAGKNKLPLILFAASGGARMQEGILSLMQMAKTSAALARFSEKGLLYISVLTDPTTGGVTASFASLATLFWPNPARSSASPGLGSFSRPSARPCRRAFSGRSFRWSTALWTRWFPGRICGTPSSVC